jgi:hypothetical protein
MNCWFRQFHRWMSIAFTVGVITYMVAMATAPGKQPPVWMGLLALLPLIVLLLTGLYLFALPYAAKWRGRRHVAVAA